MELENFVGYLLVFIGLAIFIGLRFYFKKKEHDRLGQTWNRLDYDKNQGGF